MKKIVYFFLSFVAITILTVSCDPLVDEPTFDETFLYGKWQSGTLFYSYSNDGKGTTWDTADDVTEAEAQKFTWTLDKATLTHIHVLEVGGTVPKTYTVTELTDSTLKYHDDFSKQFSFVKVKP